MYIQPNSTVIVLNQVKVNSAYDDTFYWSSSDAQTQFFLSRAKKHFYQNTYVRSAVNRIKVEAQMEDLYDCNYMMFKNDSFENKWFYAFINKINYINNITCEIEYEIDSLQTWYWDFELSSCFIERCHTESDEIGEHLLPEPIALSEYVDNKNETVQEYERHLYYYLNDLDLVIATAVEKNLNDEWVTAEGEFFQGTYSGLRFYRYRIVTCNPLTLERTINQTAINQANALLKSLVEDNKSDSVVSVFMFPSHFCDTNTLAPGFPQVLTRNFDKTKLQENALDGYIPINNKLYTYPYNILYCTTGNGNSNTYRIEYFRGNNIEFKINAQLTCSPELELRPLNYNLLNTFDTALTINNFPQCAYAIDSYKQWVAENNNKVVGSLFNNVITGATSASAALITQNPVAFVGTVHAVTASLNTFYEITQEMTKGGKAQNTGNTTSIDLANGNLGFHFYQYCLTQPTLIAIDEFFHMYGYQVNHVAEPNIHAREDWTYIKTKGANIHGALPNEDARKIEEIFDKGIRFWADPYEIGMYYDDEGNLKLNAPLH